MFEGPEIHSSGVPAVQFPQYFDPLVVASALPGPAFSSRSMFSFPAPTLPINPPGCLPVWLPYLWISLAQSPGHWASFSSPPQPRPLSQLLPCLERARSAPFRSFPPQLFFSPPLHSTGIRRQGGEEGLGQWWSYGKGRGWHIRTSFMCDFSVGQSNWDGSQLWEGVQCLFSGVSCMGLSCWGVDSITHFWRVTLPSPPPQCSQPFCSLLPSLTKLGCPAGL